jgi:hypothetical protein
MLQSSISSKRTTTLSRPSLRSRRMRTGSCHTPWKPRRKGSRKIHKAQGDESGALEVSRVKSRSTNEPLLRRGACSSALATVPLWHRQHTLWLALWHMNTDTAVYSFGRFSGVANRTRNVQYCITDITNYCYYFRRPFRFPAVALLSRIQLIILDYSHYFRRS